MKEGRTTVYNKHTTPEKLEQCNKENIELVNDFLDYLVSIDRSKKTIFNYKNDLEIFMIWNLEYNNNKFFVDITKREFVKFQKHTLEEWNWSSNRIRRVKSVISSLSNYIENMLDDEYENYRSVIKKIESPVKENVREKTVFTKDELQLLLDILVEKGRLDQACMLSMCMCNGRRKSELPRMKVEYFNNDNIIYGSLFRTPETVTTKGRGSKGKQLIIYTLEKPFRPYLDLWMKYREENGIESEWLIPKKENGKYVNEQVPISTMDSWADSFSNILGKPFYWHSLRHHFTTSLSESNIPDSVIQDIVGWNSADMVRLYDDTLADAKFGKYFGENGIKNIESGSLSDL